MVLAPAFVGTKSKLYFVSFFTDVNLVKWKIIFLKFSCLPCFPCQSLDDVCIRKARICTM